MQRRIKKVASYTVCGVLVCSMIALAWVSTFRFRSVCEKCGAIRQTIDWQFPFTRWTVFERSRVYETPVSRTLATNGIVKVHDHQWIFASGGGNGVTCALGRASQVQFTVESTSVALLIETLHKSSELSFRDRILTNLFGNRTTWFVRTLPPIGSTTGSLVADDLRQWISAQSEYLDEMASTHGKE